MKPDDESLHAVPFDPVRDSLLSATETDWDWLEGVLSATDDVHAKGWLALLKEVREGLKPEFEVISIPPED